MSMLNGDDALAIGFFFFWLAALVAIGKGVFYLFKWDPESIDYNRFYGLLALCFHTPLYASYFGEYGRSFKARVLEYWIFWTITTGIAVLVLLIGLLKREKNPGP